jgi:heme/copper-type cytochrome/quinol oxidase subunit 3
VRPAARALPIDHAARRASFSRAVCLGCAQFLCVYAALHVAHAEDVHLPLVEAVSSIPLFAIFVASVAIGAATAVLAAVAFGRAERPRLSLPVILTLAIGAFGVAVLLVP